MKNVFISLGTNMGDRTENLKSALLQVSKFSKIIKLSSIYKTEAVGNESQPDFLNAAIELETGLLPYELLERLHSIENEMGRKRETKWGPRIIDLDIIFYNDLVIISPNITIPHPHAHQRRFVIEPLAEIAPDFIHPKLNMTISELSGQLSDSKKVIKSDKLSIKFA